MISLSPNYSYHARKKILRNLGQAQKVCSLFFSSTQVLKTQSIIIKLFHPGLSFAAGIEHIFGKKETNHLEKARLLRDMQHSAFKALGVNFPWFHGRKITLKNFEHALCEFHKYSESFK